MTIEIRREYLSKEDCVRYQNFLDPLTRPAIIDNIYNALGYPTSLEASKVNEVTGVIPGNSDEINLELGALYQKIKKDAEKHFGQELDLCQSNYQVLLEGGENGLHVDQNPIELEWSGLLYLNTQGEDFQGGELYFPLQDISYKPEAGTLILFQGNESYPHGVRKVTKGTRKNITFFWAKRGNVTDDSSYYGYKKEAKNNLKVGEPCGTKDSFCWADLD
jgi:hypothetical protein